MAAEETLADFLNRVRRSLVSGNDYGPRPDLTPEDVNIDDAHAAEGVDWEALDGIIQLLTDAEKVKLLIALSQQRALTAKQRTRLRLRLGDQRYFWLSVGVSTGVGRREMTPGRAIELLAVKVGGDLPVEAAVAVAAGMGAVDQNYMMLLPNVSQRLFRMAAWGAMRPLPANLSMEEQRQVRALILMVALYAEARSYYGATHGKGKRGFFLQEAVRKSLQSESMEERAAIQALTVRFVAATRDTAIRGFSVTGGVGRELAQALDEVLRLLGN